MDKRNIIKLSKISGSLEAVVDILKDNCMKCNNHELLLEITNIIKHDQEKIREIIKFEVEYKGR